MSRSLEGLLIGRTLADRYLIQEVIGRGGMSLVYRAQDERLGRPVAVKILSLPAEGHEREELRARLRREAGSAARIPPHPNVVHVYDYGTDADLDLDFIVMELLPGRDLKTAMATGGLAHGEAMRVLREAARGLAAGHRAGIVHRDVKPANVYLVGSDRLELVKILDFGIAKALETDGEEDLTRTGMVPHSPAYASPEQLDASRRLTAASDVYQLGLVAYELLTGERPFTEAERERIRAGEDVPLPARGRWRDLPEELRETIGTALRRLPADRFPDGAAMAEALGVLTDPSAPAVPPVEESEDATLAMAGEPLVGLPEPDPPARPAGRSEGRGAGAVGADAGVPVSRPGSRTRSSAWRVPGRGAQIAAAILLAVLGLWAISSMGGESAPPAAEAELDTEELDEEFRPLLVEAAEAETEDGGVPEEGPAAVDEIRRVIVEMNDAWVQGDIDRHVAHYADRVNFYGASRASRRFIAEERGGALERYPDREITIDRTAITFPEPGEAVALVDKTWSFGGDGPEWEGSARQELILELRRGVWQVVSEQDLEVYRSERSG